MSRRGTDPPEQETRAGWLETPDPGPKFAVTWSALADAQARWLAETCGVHLREPVDKILELPTDRSRRLISQIKTFFKL